MARYVDGFVIPVPRKNLGAYRRVARQAGVKDHTVIEITMPADFATVTVAP